MSRPRRLSTYPAENKRRGREKGRSPHTTITTTTTTRLYLNLTPLELLCWGDGRAEHSEADGRYGMRDYSIGFEGDREVEKVGLLIAERIHCRSRKKQIMSSAHSHILSRVHSPALWRGVKLIAMTGVTGFRLAWEILCQV